MRTTAAEIEASIESSKRDLEAARQKEHADKLVPLKSAVERAESALVRHQSRTAWAEQRITQLQALIPILAQRDNVELGNTLVETYQSIATLTAMIDDSDRVEENLTNALTDAQLTLKAASK